MSSRRDTFRVWQRVPASLNESTMDTGDVAPPKSDGDPAERRPRGERGGDALLPTGECRPTGDQQGAALLTGELRPPPGRTECGIGIRCRRPAAHRPCRIPRGPSPCGAAAVPVWRCGRPDAATGEENKWSRVTAAWSVTECHELIQAQRLAGWEKSERGSAAAGRASAGEARRAGMTDQNALNLRWTFGFNLDYGSGTLVDLTSDGRQVRARRAAERLRARLRGACTHHAGD